MIDHEHPRQQASTKAGRGQAKEEAGTPETADNTQRQLENGFVGSIALRVTPAVTRLTVYRRLQVQA